MTREDMQKVADAMGLTVHRLANGQCVTNLVGLTAVLSVEPRITAPIGGAHGLGDNVPHVYATPSGPGR